MAKSKIEELINTEFQYQHPYFYKNPYALRCELGVGDTNDEYMENAKQRALDIYNILFPHGADALFFSHWMYDYCDNGDAQCELFDDPDEIQDMIAHRIEVEAEKLRFLSDYQMKYRHITFRGLATYDFSDDEDREVQRCNRVVCFSDGKGFDHNDIIERQINCTNAHEISLVSFENECILSIYDDRGCDIVFVTSEKMKEFYKKLEPYFLEYDLEEMKKRYNSASQ